MKILVPNKNNHHFKHPLARNCMTLDRKFLISNKNPCLEYFLEYPICFSHTRPQEIKFSMITFYLSSDFIAIVNIPLANLLFYKNTIKNSL